MKNSQSVRNECDFLGKKREEATTRGDGSYYTGQGEEIGLDLTLVKDNKPCISSLFV